MSDHSSPAAATLALDGRAALDGLNPVQLRGMVARLRAELAYMEQRNAVAARECAALERKVGHAHSLRPDARVRRWLQDEAEADTACLVAQSRALAATDGAEPGPCARAILAARQGAGSVPPRLLARALLARYGAGLSWGLTAQHIGSGLAATGPGAAGWMAYAWRMLLPLVQALKAALLRHPVLQCGECPTALAGLDGTAAAATLRAYAPGAFARAPLVVFDFCSGAAPASMHPFLGDWRGQLVLSDFAGGRLCPGRGVEEAGCLWAALERFRALRCPGELHLAQPVMDRLAHIAELEAHAAALGSPARAALRSARVAPLLEPLLAQLQSLHRRALPGTPLAQATEFSLRRWRVMVRFVGGGEVPSDNRQMEALALAPLAGRPTGPFAVSVRSGLRCAGLWSLLHSAVRQGLDPCAYLEGVLERVQRNPDQCPHALLPAAWAVDPGA